VVQKLGAIHDERIGWKMTAGSRLQFIQKITGLPDINESYVKCLSDWAPEFPPITIVFASIGRQVSNGFLSRSANENIAIFNLIEEGLASGEEELVEAIATGLVEALIPFSIKNGTFEEIEPLLGQRTAEHVASWAGI